MRRILETGLTVVYPLAALVILVLARGGAFRGADTFPGVFAAAMVLSGLLSLLSRRRRASPARIVAMVAGIALSVGVVVAHRGHQGQARGVAEEAGMAALAGGPAPAIPYRHAVNQVSKADRLDLEGGWTVLNFWATWCDPCREEMPILEGFWQEHRGQGLRVVGVTRLFGDEDEAAVRLELEEIESFLAEADVTYPVVVSDSETVDAYGVIGWPTSVLIGPDSRAVAYGVGIDGTSEVLAAARRSWRPAS